MKRLFALPILMAATALTLAACGGASATGGSAGPQSPSATAASTSEGRGYGAPATAAPSPSLAPQSNGATVAARSTMLGQILVDSRGISLYLFEADRSTSSTCYGSCAQNWPPLLTTGSPIASGSVASSLLGSTVRSDGTHQVTYAGHPLYFFIGDRQPGQTTGEGINAFGGGWDVLAPNGNKIEGGN